MRVRKVTALTIVCMLLLTAAAYSADLQIKGSDTLINVVQRLAEEYMAKGGNPVAVTGGGSGTGIAALINKRCDIANASRLMKEKEIEQARSVGVNPVQVVIALDGLSVILNAANPVAQLTKPQIGAIFRGEITNWSEVGGPDRPITLYGRQSNSGTYVYFMEEVLEGDYSARMNQMNGNAQIVEGVRNDVSGIGYVGLGYIKNDHHGLTVLAVALDKGGAYFSPLDEEAVNSGNYPLVRPLQQYVDGTPQGAVGDFIAFELSEEGQHIVEEEGFLRLSESQMDGNAQKTGM